MKSQYLVYPGHGVGKEVKAAKKAYLPNAITVEMLGTGMKLVVTEGDRKRLNIRKLMSRKTANECLKIMAGNRVKPVTGSWASVYRSYMDDINSNDPVRLAKVKTALGMKDQAAGLNFGETKMFHEVTRLLVTELDLVLGDGAIAKTAATPRAKKTKTYKYQVTIEFESKVPVKAYGKEDAVQFENGLPYFAEVTVPRESLNDSFVYGSGKIKLKKLGQGTTEE